MTRLFGILVLVLTTLFSSFAGAQGRCEAGDALMGPNCVHTEWLEAGPVRQPFSTVYRMDDGKKVVVWDDQGDVKDSKASHIEVIQLTVDDEGNLVPTAVKFHWDGSRYR